MNNFKKDLACNITLICVLIFTLIHLAVITCSLFGVININLFEGFSYVVAYSLVAVCLTLYIIGFFAYKFTRLYMPNWFRILFYIAFFLFTNVYYICGWFTNVVGLIFFYLYLGFLVNIFALSIFFNSQKNDKNKLKVSSGYLVTSVFMFSVAINSIIQFLIDVVKYFAFNKYAFTSLLAYLIEFTSMLVITIAVTIIFALSLAHSKTIINACLIKIEPKNEKK